VRAIIFNLFNERFALPLDRVREVVKPQPLSPVPRAPRAILGATNLRGRVLAVVAPELLVDSGVAPWPEVMAEERLLVIDSGESAMALRVVSVEAIHELTDIQTRSECELTSSGAMPESELEPAPGEDVPLTAALCRGRARLPSGDEVLLFDLVALEDRLARTIRRTSARRPLGVTF